ncbi:MAG: hypothetical protein A2V52_06345 [Actinobacteria bacterium RBG_19FT_COMBO_54_7]|nr:MAG: hypothetical protein A2V52_06345 [Actinobacteria bacterium RBG_19FT_COMBO_54_7]
MTAMLAATSPNLSTAITNVINTAPYNTDAFLSGLIGSLDANTAKAAADGLDANGDFVDYLVRNLNGAQAAQQLNKNEAWTAALVDALDANSLGAALNTALASDGGKQFVADLLNTLDGGIVARALNANQQLVKDLLATGAAIGLGTNLKDLLLDAANQWPAQTQTIPLTSTDPNAIAHWKPLDFLSDLFTNLDPGMVAAAYNSATDPGGRTDLPYTGADGNKYTLLQVLWLKADSVLEVLPILQLEMWIHIDSLVGPIN